MSVLAVREASAAICRKKQIPMAETEAQIREFLRLAEIAVVSITVTENDIALSALKKGPPSFLTATVRSIW
ncbi:hypothetical protein RGR602_PC01198 (plasmid) [Rhizobium gallicum bv. gallicum R602sp]|uniref:Uncharacterized protein n=1 Tax=Rhizobium gallicum bv. gallicum R602sp TaxID=1041138 RepID=A0A0B4XEY8_9HYPH|nr:hypothetical protein RGR602_PC01198 [Rhizobium gallicum bv. gallicum R602sp]